MSLSPEIFKIIFDASPELVCLIDEEGTLKLINKSGASLLGYEVKEAVEGNILLDISSELIALANSTKSNNTKKAFKLKNKKGQKRNWTFTAQKIYDEQAYIYCITGTDITEKTEAEKDSEIADKLYDLNLNRLHKTLLDLQKAKSLAEETAKVKQQFLANVSHEIRTPMNAIIGFSNVLLKSNLNKQDLQYVNAIKKSGDSLMNIINEILDLSKLESGNFSFDESDFNLQEVLDSVNLLFELRIKDKELLFTTNIESAVNTNLCGDSGRLYQILVNLVGNAIKFTDKGFVAIHVEQLERKNEVVCLKFSVQDSGIGIEEKNLEKVFESFTQASSDTTRKYGGTGLGLTICKQLIELQGGKIYVESTFGVGSTFCFEVPFKIAHNELVVDEVKAEPYYLNSENLNRYNILLVEDNDINILLTSKILEDWGFQYSIAINGNKAIAKLESESFDLILMDIQMPEMDGYEATKSIRNSGKSFSNIPIIATTAHAAVDETEKAIKAGMNDYVSKPFQLEVLLQKILKYTNKSIRVENQNSQKPNNTKLTDLSYLERVAAGDKKFIIKMVELFLVQSPETLANIKQDLSNDNWNEFRSKIHKLMPSISFMGITALNKELHQIDETKLVPENLKVYNWVIEHLESIITQASVELTTYLEQLEDSVKN